VVAGRRAWGEALESVEPSLIKGGGGIVGPFPPRRYLNRLGGKTAPSSRTRERKSVVSRKKEGGEEKTAEYSR